MVSARVASVSLMTLFSACTAGPDFVRPATPKDSGYVAGNVPRDIDRTSILICRMTCHGRAPFQPSASPSAAGTVPSSGSSISV
ncbi:hypothetical protein HNQ87_000816 [Pacificimonas flava]|nr:hypothetical protein [Pacificimonas flava]